jgi:PhnB protein
MKLEVYLTFDGNCEEAMNFYKEVFGGEIVGRQRFSENPGMPVPDENKDQILHCRLEFDGNVLMASDNMPGGKTISGSNVSLTLGSRDRARTEKVFNQLAAGGKIGMPLQDTFWNAYFGMVTDKYGFNWMVNCENEQQHE